ncbi:MAG: hypothetical protein J6D30_05335 [Clostridia bacterium]|nr:hypothetical protein [Clostridia bacterium]
MKAKTKVLLTSVAAISMGTCAVVGGTFALFTSEHKASISMSAATVDVTATIDEASLKLYTRDVEQTDTFQDGGTAEFVDGELVLTHIVPGDKVTFEIDVENKSNVDVMYRVTWTATGELMDAMNVTANKADLADADWTEWLLETTTKEYTINMVVELPLEVGNDYQTKEASVVFTVEAVQASGYDLYASKAEDIRENLANGEDVMFVDDVTAGAEAGGYSKAGLKQNGQTIDGAGNELTVNGANSTWDCAIYTSGGTIKNLTIGGAFRGVFTAGCSSDIILDNVVIDNVCYTISSDGSNPNYSIIVKDSVLNGWTSYTGGYNSVSFTDCTFGKGTGGYQYAYARPYSATTFTDCVFEEGYEFDARQTTNTFVNCYVGDTLVTQDNVATLLGGDAANILVKNRVTITADAKVEGDDTTSANEVINNIMNNGGNVVLGSDIENETADASNGYGATTFQQNGGTFDGNGYTVGGTGWSTWDSAIMTKGGTIKNVKINSGMRGIFINGLTQDLFIDNVIVDGPVYTISADTTGNHNVVITNSKFMGWTSYASGFKSFSFTDCTFGYGAGYQYYRPYNETSLTNCNFEDGMVLDLRANVTLTKCYYNGELIDQAKFDALVAAGAIYTNGKTVTVK